MYFFNRKLCTKENCNYIVSMDDNDLKVRIYYDLISMI